MRRRFRKWAFRFGFVSACVVVFLTTSTLWSLWSFSRTKDLYPTLSYPAPSFRPEVTWSKARPVKWVPLSTLPRAAWIAVIAAEDGGFFRHDGVEWEQSLTKIWTDLKKLQFPHGISTLDQQIVKNLYFGARPASTRKFQEVFVARRMDSQLDKKRILEIYMNIAEWGPNVVGIGEAAQYYFKKPASRLSDYECALLANLLPNPRVRGAWVRSGRLPSDFTRLVRRTLRRLPYTARYAMKERFVAQNQ
ncbi:MAG: biosynthetic peptidoglycan transglycosylase [Bdellovibrionota bacterium]